MKVKEESEKVGLKLNIQKTKIMASGPITSLQVDGETVETVTDFISFDSRITADGDCSQEIKDACFLEEKLSIPISWPGEFHRLYSSWGCVKKLALNSTFRKLRSWHLVPSLHCK